MPDYVLTPPPVAAVPVAGSDALFPVRRIYCVGRNYAAHAREMGGDDREPPFFFQKPADAIVPGGGTIPYPAMTADLHHEVELVLAIGTGGADIAAADAAGHVFGIAVGIDLTRRDLQGAAKKAGKPWETGKAFDRSAPIGAIVPLDGGPLPVAGAIALSVNGAARQTGDLAELIWSCGEVIAELSRLFRLEPGDLIYTGTPAGVGPVGPGDVMRATVAALPELVVSIDARARARSEAV